MVMAQPHSFVREFVKRMQNQHYDPGDLDKFVSASVVHAFSLGTGASIYTNMLLPAIMSARQEIILVTCFWEKSKTLAALCETLEGLASHRRQIAEARAGQSGEGECLPPLRIRICLSSRGFFQRLFHTGSPDGYIYPSSSWSKLDLPDEVTLEAACIDLSVKSLFFLPFSVMHPKFVIIDRQRAFVPSCNVSWREWLEGCVEVTGEAVAGLHTFYMRTWDKSLDLNRLPLDSNIAAPDIAGPRRITSPASILIPFRNTKAVPTIILPSPHYRNPRFRPFPWQEAPPPPPTPLNVGLLQLFESAERHIYIQTPNLTSPPVMSALLGALQRGVDIHIVTNRRMMFLEQLVTAGTVTSWCVKRFIKRYKTLSAASQGAGKLRISYFHSPKPPPREPDSERAAEEEPMHSHIKLTIVDEEFTVLGSGNMDRASWYTSQELGVLFQDVSFANELKRAVDTVLEGRLEHVFDSAVE